MTKMGRLLAVTDLSAPARHAAERAALLSQETGARLDLLHVANLGPLEKLRQVVTDMPHSLQQQVLDAAQTKLRDLAAALSKRYGVTAATRVVSGAVLAELAKEADAMAADMIVCGARGESFMRHLILGSTAERLLSRATCPVLVVKQAAHEPYRMVLVPVDFSPSSLQAIGNARAVAPHADIALLHAFDVPFEGQMRYAGVSEATIDHYRAVAMHEATRKLQALVREAGLQPRSVQLLIPHGDPSLRIVEQEQELTCDLIVMGKHGANMIESLLIGSVTKHVLAESQCDVLVSV